MQEIANVGNLKIELDDDFACARLIITDLSSGFSVTLDSERLSRGSELESMKAEMMLRQFSRRINPM